tara:strand:+ start:1481 stop:2254 length:774 start_codon:yes stop_codon:yes gene_type:complete
MINMNLSAEQIQSNWEKMLGYINTYISDPRREKLIEFYKKHEEEIMLMPASHKKAYHNAFPGGYVDHVNRVIEAALEFNKTWLMFGAEENYTVEELVFSALNHDLGKLGDEDNYAHMPSKDEWRKKNLGEMYQFNDALSFMSVPERSIKLLVDNDIKLTKNEWLAIRLHDGLYDPANEPYLKSFMPELKPRTSLIYIVHQADLMAARIEFEKEWLPKFGKKESKVKNFKVTKNKTDLKTKALGTIKSEGLKNMLDSL